MSASTLDPVVLPSALVPPSDIAEDIRNQDGVQQGDPNPDSGPLRKLYLLGCRLCDFFANTAGHPAAIIVLIAACLLWLAMMGKGGQNLLTLILSILAITLTQMVLNQQRRNELALHLKIDELISALDGARDELAGIENEDEDTLRAARRPVA